MKSGEYSLATLRYGVDSESVLMVKGATVPLAAFRLPTKASVRFRGSKSHR